jgi:hypothetical protein
MKNSLRKLFVVGLLFSGITGLGFSEVGPVKKTTLITIPAKFIVNAPIEKVWDILTSAQGFGSLTGFVPSETDKNKRLANLGDRISATVWSDKGVLFVTGSESKKELRVTWEVSNSGYLCHKRAVLNPAKNGTEVQYWDRYTDDQSNADKTAQDVLAETKKGVKAFQSLAEKP